MILARFSLFLARLYFRLFALNIRGLLPCVVFAFGTPLKAPSQLAPGLPELPGTSRNLGGPKLKKSYKTLCFLNLLTPKGLLPELPGTSWNLRSWRMWGSSVSARFYRLKTSPVKQQKLASLPPPCPKTTLKVSNQTSQEKSENLASKMKFQGRGKHSLQNMVQSRH